MFDIDKIFITMKHYQRVIDEERSTDGEVHHKTTDVFDKEKDPEKYYCNKLIDCQLALLTDERVFNQLNGSIDDDTELLTSIVSDLEEGEDATILESYNVSTLSFQSNTRDKFVTGKVGIGPFALNNNSHILTMLYGVKFRLGYSEILDVLGLRNLSSAMDRDSKSIMSWLSGLINAHVDVAKDPYINRLNVNPYTYNLVNLLVRTGLGKTTFYFTTQPIMKQLASVYNTASGVYMIEEGLSKTLAQRKAIDSAIRLYVFANTGERPKTADRAISDFNGKFVQEHGVSAMDAIKILFSKDCNVLHDIAKGGKVEDLKNKKDEQYSLNKDLKLSFYEILMLVVIANEQFKDPAEKLSDIVKFSKIDTKKLGKNMSEILSYRRGVNVTFDSLNAFGTFENIDRLYLKSYIKTKTDNAINTFISILGGLSIAATRQFDEIVQSILAKNEYAARNVNTIKKVSKAVLALVKARFFFDQSNGYCKVNGISYKGLIDGKDSIYNMLLKIKSAIMSLPEYAEYRDRSGEPINYLLQVLTSGYTTDVPNGRFNTAKFIQEREKSQDKKTQQDLITAWDSLLHDDLHPELQQFARDLVVYAFFTSADNGGNKDLFQYVPNSWKHESGYADWMALALDDFKNHSYMWTDDDMRDVYLNNTDDNFFVRPVSKEKFTAVDNSGILSGVRITREYKNIDGKAVVIPKVTFTYESLSSAPDYIKITEGSEADGNVTTKVYIKTDTGMINGKLYPIYSQVNPRSTKFKAGNYTYGYGTRALQKSSTELVSFKLAALKQALVVGIAVRNDGTATTQAVGNDELAIRDSIIAYNKFKEAQESKSVIEPQNNYGEGWINHSGGAIGSDSYWGEIGERYGVKSNHYYHGQKTPNGNVEISLLDFEEGKYESAKAAKRNWGYQYDTMKDDRLIRNWAQVKYADEIVAIGHIVQPGERIFPNISNDTRTAITPSVTGGTGYAVGMAILHNKPVYVFDQQDGKWYKWDNSANNFVESEIPTLTKNFAGIGTRNLNEYGTKAIEDVYKKTFIAPPENSTQQFDDSDQSGDALKRCKE